MIRPIRKSFPFLVASLLFLTSTAIGVISYEEIRQREKNVTSLLPEIRPGRHSYCLNSQGRSFGAFEFDYPETIEDYGKFSLKGSLALNYNQALLSVDFGGDFTFNSLGQLMATFVEIKSSNNKLFFSTSGINPIKLNIKLVRAGSKTTLNEQVFPGPILLKATKSGAYSLVYPGFPQLQSGGIEQLVNNTLNTLSMDIAVDEQGQSNCRQDQLVPLDLTSLLSGLDKLRFLLSGPTGRVER